MYHVGFEGVLQQPLYSEVLTFLKQPCVCQDSIFSSCTNSTAHSFLCIWTNVFSSNKFKEYLLPGTPFFTGGICLTGRPIEKLAKSQQECWSWSTVRRRPRGSGFVYWLFFWLLLFNFVILWPFVVQQTRELAGKYISGALETIVFQDTHNTVVQ